MDRESEVETIFGANAFEELTTENAKDTEEDLVALADAPARTLSPSWAATKEEDEA